MARVLLAAECVLCAVSCGGFPAAVRGLMAARVLPAPQPVLAGRGPSLRDGKEGF